MNHSGKKPSYHHVGEYLVLIEDILGITDDEKKLLKSLLFGNKKGRLLITQYGTNVEGVMIDSSMNEREIAFEVIEALDRLSEKADPSNMSGGLSIQFEEII